MKDPAVAEAMELIAQACELLGWNVIMPDDDEVTYLVLGTDKQIDRIVDLLEMDANPKQWN